MEAWHPTVFFNLHNTDQCLNMLFDAISLISSVYDIFSAVIK